MKRRLDVILAILKWLEAQPNPRASIPETLECHPKTAGSIVAYHVTLCEEAGLIRRDAQHREMHRLTWSGHEYLDSQ